MGLAAGSVQLVKQEKEAHVAHKLVIVESPAKARTIGGYLGAGYVVESSIGHIRDLPNNAADTPAKIKDKPWGRLAVEPVGVRLPAGAGHGLGPGVDQAPVDEHQVGQPVQARGLVRVAGVPRPGMVVHALLRAVECVWWPTLARPGDGLQSSSTGASWTLKGMRSVQDALP